MIRTFSSCCTWKSIVRKTQFEELGNWKSVNQTAKLLVVISCPPIWMPKCQLGKYYKYKLFCTILQLQKLNGVVFMLSRKVVQNIITKVKSKF